MKIVCFGDSITAGQNVAGDERFVNLLARRFGCTIINAGVPGNTTGQGLARFESDVLAHGPELCVIAFGMNDHVQREMGIAKTPLTDFRSNLTRIVEGLREVNAVPVLCTINPIIEGDDEHYYYRRHPRDWYRDPEGAQAWIDLYNDTIRERADVLNVALADVDKYWRQALENGERLEQLLRSLENGGVDDGVHPAPEGQALFAACIGDTLQPLVDRIISDRLRTNSSRAELGKVVPIFRMFDVEKTKEFYCSFLGFQIDWEHRFEADAPLYMQVSRGDCQIHLSEHFGDGTPGAAIRIAVAGLDTLHAGLLAQKYRHARPGIEETSWHTREMRIQDPSGNKLVFAEPIPG